MRGKCIKEHCPFRHDKDKLGIQSAASSATEDQEIERRYREELEALKEKNEALEKERQEREDDERRHKEELDALKKKNEEALEKERQEREEAERRHKEELEALNEKKDEALERERQEREEAERRHGEEMDALSHAKKCLICWEHDISMVVVPCGHLCFCEECCKQYQKDTCPVCRNPITNIIKTYQI